MRAELTDENALLDAHGGPISIYGTVRYVNIGKTHPDPQERNMGEREL